MVRKTLKVILLLFSITCFANKDFVVVIPSYNNIKYFEKNLSSVLAQDYSSFRVIYIDDSSNDNMSSQVQNYLKMHDHKGRVTYIRNNVRQRALHNIYLAGHMCNSSEIMVILDGDDWFPDSSVLSYLDNEYSNNDIWLTYGSHVRYPSGQKEMFGPYNNKIITNNSFRDRGFGASPLRTFYAWLFQRIKKEDLMHKGEFLAMASDPAYMTPMFEMAGFRTKFLRKTLYVYNMNNPISDRIVDGAKQLESANIIRYKKSKYKRLAMRPKL